MSAIQLLEKIGADATVSLDKINASEADEIHKLINDAPDIICFVAPAEDDDDESTDDEENNDENSQNEQAHSLLVKNA